MRHITVGIIEIEDELDELNRDATNDVLNNAITNQFNSNRKIIEILHLTTVFLNMTGIFLRGLRSERFLYREKIIL